MTTIAYSMPFTKDDILTAFNNLKDQGIKPIQEDFVMMNGENKVCGLCAVSAYLVDEDKCKLNDKSTWIMDFSELLGVHRLVMNAFTRGFDGKPNILNSEFTLYTERKAAYDLGVEISKAIFKENDNSDKNSF